MKRYDPDRIVDNLRAIEQEEPLGEAASVSGEPIAVEPLRDRAVEPPPPLDIPTSPGEHLWSNVLPVLRDHAQIDALPPETRFRFLKRLAHRTMRIVTGRQIHFNHHVSEAVRLLTAHADSLTASLSSIAERLRADIASQAQAQREGLEHAAEESRRSLDALRQSLEALRTDAFDQVGNVRTEMENRTRAQHDFVTGRVKEMQQGLDETRGYAFEQIENVRQEMDNRARAQEDFVKGEAQAMRAEADRRAEAQGDFVRNRVEEVLRGLEETRAYALEQIANVRNEMDNRTRAQEAYVGQRVEEINGALEETRAYALEQIGNVRAEMDNRTRAQEDFVKQRAEDVQGGLAETRAYTLEQIENVRAEMDNRTRSQEEYVRTEMDHRTTAQEEYVSQRITEMSNGLEETRAYALEQIQNMRVEMDNRAQAQHAFVNARADEMLSAAQDSASRLQRQAQESTEQFRALVRQIFGQVQDEVRKVAAAAPAAEGSAAAPPVASAATELADDTAYLLYEDAWRGSPEAIRERQEEYIEILRPRLEKLDPAKRLTLDAGCGRGEFLEALGAHGLPAKGIEINRAFVAAGREAGLDIEKIDVNAYLESLADDSLGAIVAFQVIEHLEPAYLRRLLELARRRLAPGGCALFETLNPGSFSAYRWYFMDLSHVRFLPPETVRFAAECAGLEYVETRLVHPMAEHERLSPTGSETLRANIERLNDTLYGPQDYYILFQKPAVR